ncbi:MAG: hypothetical protein PHF89_04340 [Eubacteriales bacterium]|jgi:hypothetical protein|nr:hypothetical protein [Eubacteriales bacterium]
MLKKHFICAVVLIMAAAFFSADNVFASSGILSGSLRLESASTYSIFEGNTAQHKVKWVNLGSGVEKTVQIKVINYFGNVEFLQEYTAAPSAKEITVTIDNLPYGHFTIIASIGDESVSGFFSLVPNMEDRRDSSKSPFALASMATRHTLTPIIQDSLDEYVRTISLAGVHYVREFLVARQVFLGEDSYNYSVGKLDRLIQAYSDNNIDVVLMYQMMPGFLCRDGQRIPNDLLGTYRLVKQLVENFKGKIDAIEIENEPEHYADTNPADYYAAFLKASAVAIQDADKDVKIVNAALIPTKNALYRRTFFQNQIKDYIDAYNWHTYSVYNENINVIAYRPFITDVISEAHKNGMFDKPLWTTETGLQIPVSDTSSLELTYAEQISQARYAPTASVVALSMGEDKHFWFTHGYFYEHGNCYGTMTQTRMPYAIYSSISAYNNAMGNGVYKGKFKNIPSDVNGYAFVDGNESVGCFWSETPKTITLNIGQTSGVLIDIMGNETPISPNNGNLTINVGPDIVYLRIAGEFNPQIIEAKERIEKAVKSVDLSSAQRIILQQEMPLDKIGNGYYKMNSNSENTVILNVYNFNEEAVEGKIDAKSYYEWEVQPQSRWVSIPPMSKVQLEYTVVSSGATNSTMPVPLVFSGVFDGEKTSDCVSYIKDDTANITPAKAWSGFDVAASWRKSNNSESKINIYRDSLGVIRFDCSFSGGNLWSFPYVNLPATQGFFNNSTGIIYEYKADKSISGAVFGIYLVNTAGETFSAFKSVTLDSSWRQIIFNWDDFYKNSGESLDYKNIVSARIGMHFPNANANDFKFYIRNLGLGVSSENETLVDLSMLGYTQNSIGVAFANSEVPIKDGRVVFDIDGQFVLGMVENGEALVYYPMATPPKEIAVMAFDESNRMIYKKILNNSQQKKNGVFVFGYSASELNNAVISVFDVSGLETANGHTDYIDEDTTPRIGTGLTVSESGLFFELPQDYQGKFVVNAKTPSGKSNGLLLSRDEDIFSGYDYSITNVDDFCRNAMVYSLKRDKATIIFSAYSNGRLVGMGHKDIYFNAGEQLINAPSTFNVGNEVLDCSVMIWDELESLVPLSKSLSLLYTPDGFSNITVIGTTDGNAIIELTGNAGRSYSNKEISLLITRKDVALSPPLSYADLIYVDQTTADNNGKYTFVLPWNQEKGSIADYNFDLYLAGEKTLPNIR